MPCAALLFFLIGLSSEIKRIIIAFPAVVNTFLKIFLMNFLNPLTCPRRQWYNSGSTACKEETP